MNIELLPVGDEERELAFLGFTTLVGGGVLAYEAGRAIRDGDLFKTDAVEKNAEAGLVATTVGIGALVFSANELAKEVGWKPIVVGSTAVGAIALFLRAIRR